VPPYPNRTLRGADHDGSGEEDQQEQAPWLRQGVDDRPGPERPARGPARRRRQNHLRGEGASGTKRTGRTELEKVLGVLGEGDTLVVTRLDRLGRSLRDLANVAHEIDEAGANLRVLEQAVDTSTAAGRAFFGMLAVFAAFETDVRRERQMEGIALAKRRGVYEGRKPTLDRARVRQMAKEGIGPGKIARELGMARSSVYRLLEEGRDHGRSRGNKRPAATP
jgi:DNA invertase Pin-like site-specific DNA recombinase